MLEQCVATGPGSGHTTRQLSSICRIRSFPGTIDPRPIRQGNNPKRRLAPRDELDAEDLRRLAREARYVGSAHHKSKPGDYRFTPPTSPRPNKSLCDGKRIVKKREAMELFRQGLSRGMVSRYAEGGFPKYVWAVDWDDEVYEAKLGGDDRQSYHGYALNADGERDLCRWVIREWNARAGTS